MMSISYSTMAKYTFYAVFLLSIGISTTSGGLVNSPSDQNVTVGERVTFFCKTNLDLPVYWYLNHTHEIFYGGRVSMSYKDVYEVDSTNKGEYNLIIASANESNNGEYTCGDDEGQGEKKSARLHVTAPISTTEAESGESTESVRKLTMIIVAATVVGIGLLVISIIACVLIRRRLRDRPQPIVMKAETRDGNDNKEENDGLLDENPQQGPNNKEENVGIRDQNRQPGPNNKEENVGIRDQNRQPDRPQPTLKKAETRDGPDNKKENDRLLDENPQQGPNNKEENVGIRDQNRQPGPNNKEEKAGLRYQNHEPGSSSQGIVPSPKMSTNPPPASAVQNANTDDEAEKAATAFDFKATKSHFETPANKDSNTQGAAAPSNKEENDGLLDENPQQGPNNKEENVGIRDQNRQPAPNNKEENDGLLGEHPQQGPNIKEDNAGLRDQTHQPDRPQPTLKKAETRDGSSSQGIVPSPKMSTNPPPASAVQNANTDDEAEKAATAFDFKATKSHFETPANKDSNTQGAAGVTVKPQPLSSNPSFLK